MILCWTHELIEPLMAMVIFRSCFCKCLQAIFFPFTGNGHIDKHKWHQTQRMRLQISFWNSIPKHKAFGPCTSWFVGLMATTSSEPHRQKLNFLKSWLIGVDVNVTMLFTLPPRLFNLHHAQSFPAAQLQSQLWLCRKEGLHVVDEWQERGQLGRSGAWANCQREEMKMHRISFSYTCRCRRRVVVV